MTENERPDGFRPRRKREKGWLKQAIAEGSVRDPDAPDPDEGKDYTGKHVIQPPVMTATVDGKETPSGG